MNNQTSKEKNPTQTEQNHYDRSTLREETFSNPS